MRGRGVRTRVRIVGLRVGVAAIGVLRCNRAAVSSGARVVPSSCPHRTVRSVNGVTNTIESRVRVVNRRTAVGVRIRIVNRISRTVIDVRWIVVAGAVDHDGAYRHSQYKHAEIAARIARLDRCNSGIGDGHIRDVIDRRTGRDRAGSHVGR